MTSRSPADTCHWVDAAYSTSEPVELQGFAHAAARESTAPTASCSPPNSASAPETSLLAR